MYNDLYKKIYCSANKTPLNILIVCYKGNVYIKLLFISTAIKIIDKKWELFLCTAIKRFSKWKTLLQNSACIMAPLGLEKKMCMYVVACT